MRSIASKTAIELLGLFWPTIVSGRRTITEIKTSDLHQLAKRDQSMGKHSSKREIENEG
jgi:hypothetical protein